MDRAPISREMIMPLSDLERKLYQVWIDEEKKIASFHKIAGGKLTNFLTQEMFLSYIDNLVYHLYRFQ